MDHPFIMSKDEDRGNAAGGIKLERAYEKLNRAYRDLKDAHIEMVFRLAFLAELRDSQTGGHLVRIADYSAIIAEDLGLGPEEVEIIRYATPMHDVGKIMLPDKILKKSGKLTDEERTLMRKHPKAGADIFKNSRSDLLKACEIIALTHHERFDGTGYPEGLSGGDIPLYGRITALADCFDAYTSKRSYKEAYGFDEAVSMIRKRSGTHFDPDVVRSFTRNTRRLRQVWQANRDIEMYLKDMGRSGRQ
ncbi:MAG: HD domain-containing protein [Candidatus Omnitrophica bacterium]|nr:HD domain-containing protein [Candidatus Omnitrophota bacterium]